MESGPLNDIVRPLPPPNGVIGSLRSQLSSVYGTLRQRQTRGNQALEELCCWKACLALQETQISELSLSAMNPSPLVLQGRPCPENNPEWPLLSLEQTLWRSFTYYNYEPLITANNVY